MAFVRAIGKGLDVDGDGTPDTRGEPLYYAGNSLGGIYGTLFLAVEPRIQVGRAQRARRADPGDRPALSGLPAGASRRAGRPHAAAP